MPKLYEVAGQKVWLYKKNEVSKMFGLSKTFLSYLTKEGAIPETPLTDSDQLKSRLYCWAQLEPIVRICAWHNLTKRQKKTAYKEILEEWKKIPLFAGLTDEDFSR